MAIQGIIRPPPDIRAVADKTASFVAKNGRAFETRIVNSAKGKTPKFAFLHESSPFHAYYEDRIVFYQNGGTDDTPEAAAASSSTDNSGTSSKKDVPVSEKITKQDQQASKDALEKNASNQNNPQQKQISTRKAKSIVDPIARELLLQRGRINTQLEKIKKEQETKDQDTTEDGNDELDNNSNIASSLKLDAPPKLSYTTTICPKNISLAQLDIIKLTAQFVAMNGKGGSFLRDLTLREWNNHNTFGFLQPRHAHYAFFSHLIDIYRHILSKWAIQCETNGIKKTVDSNDESGISNDDNKNVSVNLMNLQKMKKVIGLDSSIENSNYKTTANTAKDYNSIKLSILKEVDLLQKTSGNISNCLEEIAYRTEYFRHQEEERRAQLEERNATLGGSSFIDWHDFVVVETIDFPVDEEVDVALPPPSLLPSPPVEPERKQTVPKQSDDNEEMDESSDESESDEEEIKVVPDYTPKVVSSQAKLSSTERTHVIDPITKKIIPIEDMTEHMRIQLLDPKWAEENKRFMEKQKESNLLAGDAIARNITAFAKARGDMFGSSTEELSTQDDDAKRHLEEANRIVQQPMQMPQPLPPPLPQPPFAPPLPPHLHMMAPPAPGIPFQSPFTLSGTSVSGGVPMPMPIPIPVPPEAASTLSHPKPDISLPPTKKIRSEDSTSMLHPSKPDSLELTNDIQIDGSKAGADQSSFGLLSEEEFVKSLPDPNITLLINIPNDQSNPSWNLKGQTLTISINVMAKIKTVKEEIQSLLGGMPLNKIQLKSTSVRFLKDGNSLASLNISSNSTPLELVPKTRGGRK